MPEQDDTIRGELWIPELSVSWPLSADMQKKIEYIAYEIIHCFGNTSLQTKVIP